ncbi:DUF6894 family protein [Methylobacterium sp. CM6257]|jgi:hypothetical protein
MPLFYFHLHGPRGLERDDAGLELSGIEAAYLEAYRAVPAMSADLAQGKENPARYAFEIADASGNMLMEVPFTEVLDCGRKPVPPSTAAQVRDAAVEMARTAYLISAIREERAALRATLAETRRLLALSRRVGQASL